MKNTNPLEDSDDLREVIDAAQHFKYHEHREGEILNRISALPESKPHLKRAIKERIRLLYTAYVSLATFVIDEHVDAMTEIDKEHAKVIVDEVFVEMERARKELEAFNPFE